MNRPIMRGDIYYADLSPVVGSEQGGFRPIIVVQNDIGNKFSPTVIAAAITSKTTEKAKLPTHVPISTVSGLEKNSLALLEQIRTIDRRRLGTYIGTLDDKTMQDIDHALLVSFGLKS